MLESIQLKLKYGATGLKDSTGTDIILDADGSKQGLHSIIAPLIITKKDSAFEIISILFDRFIMFQKYIITRQILNELYKYIIQDTPTSTTGVPAKLILDKLKYHA